jgi:hypothetical protein
MVPAIAVSKITIRSHRLRAAPGPRALPSGRRTARRPDRCYRRQDAASAHPAARPRPARRPHAGLGHHLAAVSAGRARGVGMDFPRRVGGHRGRSAAASGAAARAVAGHRAAPLAHRRRRELLLPRDLEHRQHLFGGPHPVGTVGDARLHDAVVVGADRLGGVAAATGGPHAAGDRARCRGRAAADGAQHRRLCRCAAGLRARPAGRAGLGDRHADPQAQARRRAGHRADRLAAAAGGDSHHARCAGAGRRRLVHAVVAVDPGHRLHRGDADVHRQRQLVLDRRPAADQRGRPVVDPGPGGRDGVGRHRPR